MVFLVLLLIRVGLRPSPGRVVEGKKTSDFGFFCRSGNFSGLVFFGTRAGAPGPGYGMKLAENALTGRLLTADNKNTPYRGGAY